jgi:NifB/MoaA-like Fe-S oxidoreductase
MVTVSGLLTGQDLLDAALAAMNNYDTVVLPPNCLNRDELFLDDMSLSQFRERLAKRVVVGDYDLADTLKEAFQ